MHESWHLAAFSITYYCCEGTEFSFKKQPNLDIWSYKYLIVKRMCRLSRHLRGKLCLKQNNDDMQIPNSFIMQTSPADKAKHAHGVQRDLERVYYTNRTST